MIILTSLKRGDGRTVARRPEMDLATRAASVVDEPVELHHGLRSSFKKGATMHVCPPTPGIARKAAQIRARRDPTDTRFRYSSEIYFITTVSSDDDHFQRDCKADSMPI